MVEFWSNLMESAIVSQQYFTESESGPLDLYTQHAYFICSSKLRFLVILQQERWKDFVLSEASWLSDQNSPSSPPYQLKHFLVISLIRPFYQVPKSLVLLGYFSCALLGLNVFSALYRCIVISGGNQYSLIFIIIVAVALWE